jgi:general secretion pathway protein N
VSALAKLSVRARDHLRGSIFGLALVVLGCGHSQDSALAATEPVDGAAIETSINPPLADPTTDASRPNQPADRAPTGNPLWAVPLRSLSITRERPLFSPSRRPPPAAVVAAPFVRPAQLPPKAVEPDHPLLTLVGTIVGENQSIGIFVDQVGKNVIRLKTGQGHAGWTLRTIQGRAATFEKDQREATLILPARSATDQAAASVPGLIPVAAQPGGTWMDGDGQLISPPPSPSTLGDEKPLGPPPSTWTDGDGQQISATPAHIEKSTRH